jgi:hypothetical protein
VTSWESVIPLIHDSVWAQYLTLITRPVLFSKQWLNRLSAVGSQIEKQPVLLIPSDNLADSFYRANEPVPQDENGFQTFARLFWKKHRGEFRMVSTLPIAVSCLSWTYLKGSKKGAANSATWFKSLQESGVDIFHIVDTCICVLPSIP